MSNLASKTDTAMEAVIDKDQLRKSLKELAVHDPDFVRQLLLDMVDELKQLKRQRLEQIVNEDFAEYEAVFRALA